MNAALRISCFLFSFMLIPKEPSFAYDQAHVAQLLQQQSFPELLQLADQTPEAEVDNYLLNAAGYSAYQMSIPEKAVGYFTRALLRDEANAIALLYLGLIKKQQHSLGPAITYFSKLIALNPKNGRYYKYASECYAELKKPDSALLLLTAGYLVAPNDPSIGVAYANALLEKKQYTRADSVLQGLLAVAPGNSLVLASAIKSNYLQKKFRNVLPLADSLILSPQVAYAPLFYGLLAALQLKDYPKGLSYAEILRLGGYENEQVLYYSAKLYAGLKRYEESNQLLEQCIRKSISENIEAYYTELAENKMARKNYAASQHYYDTARYLSGNPMIAYRKAIAYDDAKQPQLARKAYADFLKNPGNADTAVISYAKSRLVPRSK